MSPRKKGQKKTYTVQITEEQVSLIRSFAFRTTLLWMHTSQAAYVTNTGWVDFRSVHSCFFCHQGSYESLDAIAHTQDCVVTQMEREYASLNTQFLAQEEKR